MINLKQILVPIAVVAVGVLGAFATQMSGNSSNVMLAAEQGWIDNSLPCTLSYMCESSGPYICTAILDGQPNIVKGKFSSTDVRCDKVLFQHELP